MVECGSFQYIEPSRAIVQCVVESSRVMWSVVKSNRAKVESRR